VLKNKGRRDAPILNSGLGYKNKREGHCRSKYGHLKIKELHKTRNSIAFQKSADGKKQVKNIPDAVLGYELYGLQKNMYRQ